MIERLFSVLAALVFVLLVGASCASDGPSFLLDPMMTSRQERMTRAAAAKWNGVVFAPLSVDGGDWYIELAPPVCLDCPLGRCAGCTHGSRDPVPELRRLIQIDPATPDGEYKFVVLHEMGHSIGLGHTSKGIMSPGSGATEFSFEDIAECRRVHACW